MENDLITQINEVLSGKGENTITSISHEMKLREDLGFDSFDLAELTVRLEEVFNVDIFANGIVNTIGEIIAVINKNE